MNNENLQLLAAQQPQLEQLDLSNWNEVTDKGLQALQQLPSLKKFVMQWHKGVTDAGISNLRHCANIEYVDLMGTATGDGVIRALAGKPRLRHLKTGYLVTDGGLAMLRDFPAFKTWQEGEIEMSLTGFEAAPTYLKLEGSFTDKGIAALEGLDGLFALSLDNNKLAITAACLTSLQKLSNLGWLGFDAKDESMPGIAALPKLRFLMCQDTSAGDDGFEALSRSNTIEYIWGRRCYNLGIRGFKALSRMPALRALSVSCKNVGDEGIAALPHFPALKELMPMDVPDEGYRHIGQCKGLESLVLMYCRDTTDISTSHITGLPQLKYYFASYNKITDRSMEMLSGIRSLEHVSLSNIAGVTNDGVAALVRLPGLKYVDLGGMPGVTKEVVGLFPSGVRVRYNAD
ncbi:MAG TPA: hypothetical protein VD996_12350 [Chitinophagaceae bacterium]|nr:hypothetical protein [Chitinophagaceae bacterium]